MEDVPAVRNITISTYSHDKLGKVYWSNTEFYNDCEMFLHLASDFLRRLVEEDVVQRSSMAVLKIISSISARPTESSRVGDSKSWSALANLSQWKILANQERARNGRNWQIGRREEQNTHTTLPTSSSSLATPSILVVAVSEEWWVSMCFLHV
jgi:hypothetical protein